MRHYDPIANLAFFGVIAGIVVMVTAALIIIAVLLP